MYTHIDSHIRHTVSFFLLFLLFPPCPPRVQGALRGNPEPSDGTLYRVTESYRAKVGSNYIYTVSFPTVKGSTLTVKPKTKFRQLYRKGPNWNNDVFVDYRIHCLIHSSIPEEKVWFIRREKEKRERGRRELRRERERWRGERRLMA
jgi:hypothetical protein